MQKRYHSIVFGCQMNVSDAERVSAVLESIGYQKTQAINKANLIVVTMCSIRQSAVDRVDGLAKKFSALGRSASGGKKPITILTGCVLKKDKKIFLNLFDYVVDIKNIKNLPNIIGFKKTKSKDNYLNIKPTHSSKFSATVPIMTGCNNFCAYCVVPYVREREISRPAKDIIKEIENLIKNGYKEIWLLGQNVNSYKSKEITFPKLLKLVNNVTGDFWIRFTSSHPKDFDDKVINSMAECKKVTPYLNLPIQSGDDKVLKLMNRRYTVSDYKNKIKKLRKKIPGICLSTDIIVGFPGETKKQFENTIKLFYNIKYDMAYINKYSPRSGTAAAKLEDNVSWDEKKRREKALNNVLKQTALENNKKYVGKTVEILVDNNKTGRTKEYKLVVFKSNQKPGEFIKATITKATPWHLEIN